MRYEDAMIVEKYQENKRTIIVILATVALLVVFDLLTPFGGNIRFYAKWVQCGQKPVQRSLSLGTHILHYETAPTIGAFFGNKTDYYCTPLDAELAGLSADSTWYYYPHLKQ